MSKRTNRTMVAATTAAVLAAAGWTISGQTALAADAPPATQPAPAAAAADFSTPKGAAAAFGAALLANDMKAARSAAVGSPEQLDMVEAFAPVLASGRRMSDAAAKAFGPENALTRQSAGRGIAVEVENFDFKVEGDSATMVRKDRPTAASPMKLVRRDGGWRVDLSSLPPELSMAAQMSPALVKAADEVTADIAAGKHTSADEAQQAYLTKVMGNLMQPPAKAPATKPATAPAAG